MTTATDEQRIAEAIELIASAAKVSEDGWDQIQRRIRRDRRRRSFRSELLVIAAVVTFLVAAGVVVQREAGGGDVVASGGGRLEFGFEGEPDEMLLPPGWKRAGLNSGYEFRSVDDVVHSGERAGRIRLAAQPEPDGFGTLMRCENADGFAGNRVRLSGHVSTRGATGDGAGLWLRADGANDETVAFDNMFNRSLIGDHPYTPAEVVLDIPVEAEELCFGFLLMGAGTAWADTLLLEVVGDLGDGPPVTADNEPGNLDFELGAGRNGFPVEWGGGGTGYVVGMSAETPRSGQGAGTVAFKEYAGDDAFGTLTQCVPAHDYRGRTVVYRGWLQTKDVGAIGAGLWLRIDVGEETVFLDNMQDRPIRGTTEWRQYEIKKAVPQSATQLCFGVLLSGVGTVLADDLSLTTE